MEMNREVQVCKRYSSASFKQATLILRAEETGKLELPFGESHLFRVGRGHLLLNEFE
jgi:hypothetical protein